MAMVPVGTAVINIVDSALPAGAVQTGGTDPTTVVLPEGGTATDSNGFQLPTGTRVVIVDDVCTKGGSIAECATLVREHGALVVRTGSIIDRSGGQRAFEDPFVALVAVQAEAVKPEECALCKQGIPTEKPGSRRSETA